MPRLSPRARKDFNRLEPKLAQSAAAVLKELAANPKLGKMLLGKYAGLWTVRVARTHRMKYEVKNGKPFIVSIDPRKDAYR